jgi:hypothetical protein
MCALHGILWKYFLKGTAFALTSAFMGIKVSIVLFLSICHLNIANMLSGMGNVSSDGLQNTGIALYRSFVLFSAVERLSNRDTRAV